MTLLKLLSCLVLFLCWPLLVSAERKEIRVRLGYFTEARPVHAPCALGWFDYKTEDTHYKVICYPQSSGVYAAARLDDGDLDMAHLGSPPLAQAMARGVNISTIYNSVFLSDTQGIYVRASEGDYEGIKDPFDLRGRRVGLPRGSTSHIQVLYTAELFGLTDTVEVVDLSPPDMISAWDNKEVDALACWGTARQHALKEGGRGNPDMLPARTLLTSRTLGDWGMPSFAVLAARREFALEHSEFLTHFVAIFSRVNDSFLDKLGFNDPANARRWNAQGAAGESYVPSMSDSLMVPGEKAGEPSESFNFAQRQLLDLALQQTVEEQLSCNEGLGRPDCEQPSIMHSSIRDTARFLVSEKVIASMGRLQDLGEDELCQNPNTVCGGNLFDSFWLKEGTRNCTDCYRLGPYEGLFAGSDNLLSELERMNKETGRSPFPPGEIGRYGGDSTCDGHEVIAVGEDGVAFGDGADAMDGKSYSDGLHCTWEVRGPDCLRSSSQCQQTLSLAFEALRVWSGDFVRVYTDPNNECKPDSEQKTLLAQFSSHQEPGNLPPIKSKGCLLVEFDTDGRLDRTYGDSANLGDGIFVRVGSEIDAVPDCIQAGNTDLSWGGDCSFSDYCLGMSKIDLSAGDSVSVSSSGKVGSAQDFASSPDIRYPNGLDCVFEFHTDTDYVEVQVYHDLETVYDLIWLQSGSPSSVTGTSPYVVLTGNNEKGDTWQPDTYLVPTDSLGVASLHLKTDWTGRRRGFYAEVRPISSAPPARICEGGYSGVTCEVPHCIALNQLGQNVVNSRNTPEASILGRIISQSPGTNIPAMPWAPDGGCTWTLLEDSPAGVGIRLVFNQPLDLEPHPSSGIGDKLVIRTDKTETTLFNEKCLSSDACLHSWQTGLCEDGSCTVRNSVELETSDIEYMEAVLFTDMNDKGIDFQGIDLEFLVVEECPTSGKHCLDLAGTQCLDGYCFCDGNVPCGCTCQGEPAVVDPGDDGLTTGGQVAIGVSAAVFILIVYILSSRRESDSVWVVPKNELHFQSPPEVIGLGSFGPVLLADYHGTKVAVKRVSPPQEFATVAASYATATRSRLALAGCDRPETAQPSVSTSRDSAGKGTTSERTRGSGEEDPENGQVKTIDSKSSSRKGQENFAREMRIMSRLRHPCLATVMGTVLEDGKDPLLLMEYLDYGSLYDLLHNDTMELDGKFVLNCLLDVAEGMVFLHTYDPPVVHGCLKASNILVNSRFRAKVADYRLMHVKKGGLGPPLWNAPELLRGETTSTLASDMYALGMVIYEMYSRKDPYEGEDEDNVIEMIKNKGNQKRPPIPAGCPPKMAQLMKFLLHEDPTQRPGAKELKTRFQDLDISCVEPEVQPVSHGKTEDTSVVASDMYYKVFPHRVAEVLLRGGQVEAESFRNVSILMADISGLDEMIVTLSPEKLSNLFDRFREILDPLTHKYEVFKIRTISDSYMFAANLAKVQADDHMKRIGEFAIDLVKSASKLAIDEDNLDLGQLRIQIGVHTGHVVTNVVGERNPRYVCFGDAVTIAKKMAITSEPGKIHCSERGVQVLLDQTPLMNIVSRGNEASKKGATITYWLPIPVEAEE